MLRDQGSSEKPDHEENENRNYRDIRDVKPGLAVMFDWQQVPRVKIRAIALHGFAPFPSRVPRLRRPAKLRTACSCVAGGGAPKSGSSLIV